MATQDQAIKDVGTAFSTGPAGTLTPAQQAAFEKVQSAFAEKPVNAPIQQNQVIPPTADPTTTTQSPQNATFDYQTYFKNLFGNEVNPFVANDTTTSARLSELKALEEQRIAAAKSQINSEFDILATDAKRSGENQIATNSDLLGRMGSGMRTSSAGVGFVDAAKNQMEKNIRDLEAKRQSALASLDTELAGKLAELTQNEYARLDKLAETRFTMMMDLLNMNMRQSESTYTMSQGQFEKDIKTAQLDIDIINELMKVPANKVVTIGGKVYQGVGSQGDLKFFQETVMQNGQPISKVFSIDSNTGKVVNSATLGTARPSSGNTTIIRSSSGSTLSGRLGEEVDNVMSGLYGNGATARDTAITILTQEFPQQAATIRQTITARIPDTVLPSIKAKTFNLDETPVDIRNQLINDLRSGSYDLDQLMSAYPEVDPAAIENLYMNI